MGLTVLLGGARSGKSSLAVDLGRRHEAGGGRVVFVATATRVDDDIVERIERHVAERPPTWTTVEAELDLIAAIDASAGADSLVVVDCLTLWVSNLLWAGRSDTDVADLAVRTAEVAARAPGRVVAVSNEVGMGVHPETELGRRYRDVLGRVNQAWAGAADHALLLVAGRALALADPDALLPPIDRSSAIGPDRSVR